MRATFGIVLAAGIAAAVGISMLRRDAERPAAGEAQTTASADPPPPPLPPEERAEVAADPAPPPRTASPLAARLDDLLARRDATAAAHALLEEDGALSDPEVRARAFRTAETLASMGESTKDAAAQSARVDARRVYAALFACDEASAAETTRAFEGCARLHQALLYGNGAPDSLALRHKVQAGESVWALARGPWKQRGVTAPPGFVLHVNGVSDARRLRVGQTLRVPLERLKVLVRKSRFELAVLLGEAPIERFTVAIGADASTPSGVFRVRDRIKNPDWYFRGRRIPFGDPQNIIGTRWIGLSGSAAADGIGIHGTTDESSVGRPVSMGCVRMHNADVEKLFEWLDAGVEVEIRD